MPERYQVQVCPSLAAPHGTGYVVYDTATGRCLSVLSTFSAAKKEARRRNVRDRDEEPRGLAGASTPD